MANNSVAEPQPQPTLVREPIYCNCCGTIIVGERVSDAIVLKVKRNGQLLFVPDSPPKIVGMAFVGLQQVWGVNRGVDRTLRGVSERIGNG